MRQFVESIETRRLLAATFTGHTFEDVNADGVYAAATDRRLAGVTAYVDLNRDGKYESTEPHATSDGGGAYTIASSSLGVGKSYSVGFVFAAGYTQSAPLPAVTPHSGTTALADVGAWRYAAVRINGFLDPNDNGRQDPGETAPGDVTYWDDANQNNQKDPGEAVVGPGNGTMNLKPGLHLIWPQYTGAEYELTGGVNTLYVTATSGEAITLNFGYFHPAPVAGHLYQDTNHNGRYDPGEGLGERDVYADVNNDGREDAGDFGDSTTPDGSFTMACGIGTFKIREAAPKGWANGTSPTITVKSGTAVVSAGHDLESHPVATSTTGVITGTVFTDNNGNAKKDGGDGAWAGDSSTAFIDLDHDNQYDPDQEPAFADTGSGTFTISSLKPGTYRIGLEGFGVSTTKSHDVVVTAGKISSAGAYGMQPRFYLNVDTFRDDNRNGKLDPVLENNAGDKLSGDDSVSGRVIYLDANNNGQRDPGEAYQTTGEDGGGGGTLFDLPPGTYTFREELPAGWYETGRDASGLSVTTTFTADGRIRLPGDAQPDSAASFEANVHYTLNFLSAPNLLVHGRVYDDANGNGKQDGGETVPPPTLGGGNMVYADTNGNGRQDAGESAAYINPDGTFAIALAPGAYTIRQALNTGWTQTSAGGATVTVGKNTASVPTIVFGRHATATATKFFTVSGRAIVDDNENGKYDEPEGQNAETLSWDVYVDTNHSGDLDDDDLYVASVNGQGQWSMTLPADGKTYRVLLNNESRRAFTSPAFYDVSSTTDGQSISLFFGLSPDDGPPSASETAGISGVAATRTRKTDVVSK